VDIQTQEITSGSGKLMEKLAHGEKNTVNDPEALEKRIEPC